MNEPNKRLSKRTEWLSFLCFAMAILLLAYGIPALLIPHRTDFGSTWGSFLQEDSDSLDAVFFGSSIAYCDIIPAVIYEQAGVTSYVMAGPEQTLPQTYYYVKEMFRTQSPGLVVVEVTGVYYKEFQNYTKVNIGYMPWSINRLAATFKASEPEQKLGLLFPLYNYHDRWASISLKNLHYAKDPYAGYTLLTKSTAMAAFQERTVTFDERVFAQNIETLRDIAELCREQGSEVLFMIAPTYYPWEREYRDLLKAEITAIDGAEYIDFNTHYDQLGIDEAVDYYDHLHFNRSGAQKFSEYLASYIAPYIGSSRITDPALWDTRVEAIRQSD